MNAFSWDVVMLENVFSKIEKERVIDDNTVGY